MSTETIGTIGVDVEPSTRAGLESLSDSLGRLSDRVKGAAASATSSMPSWGAARDGINALGENVSRVGGELLGFAGQVVNAADRIAALTTESANLERNAARLGLDFDAAAEAAGRFTDETDVMTAATRFASTGVRLTQGELEALTRTAAAYSQDAGVPMAAAMQMLSDGTIAGTEALRRFGPEMAALQGPAHSVGERLAAIERHARDLAPATDDAASSMARLRDSYGDAQREMARGFSDQIAQAIELGSVVQALGGDLDDTTGTLRAIGSAAADVVGAVVNTVAAVVSMVAIAASATRDALSGQGFAQGADTQQLYRVFLSRTEAVNAAIERLGSGGGPAPRAAAPRPAAAPGGSMTFTEAEAAAIEGDQTARSRRAPSGGGGGGSRGARSPSLDDLMGTALERMATRASLGALTVPGEADAIAGDAGKRGAQRAADEAAFALERQRDEEGKARQSAAEAAQVQNRLDLHLGFTDQWERLHQRQVNASEEAATSITSALGSLGSAYSDAIQTFVTGEATIGQALQGMLSKTLSAISKEASVKAGFQLAEGLATLFTNPAESGSHFAAFAGFTAVAAAAGALGDLTAVEKAKSASAGASAPGSRGSAEQLGGRSAANDNAGGPRIYQFYAPYIDGRFATRDRVGEELGIYTDAADRERRVGRRRAA